MSLANFRSYQLSLQFSKACHNSHFRGPLRDQIQRASSSVALNLAEGYGRLSGKDQLRFFSMALGSLRECQAALDLLSAPRQLILTADHLGASLFCLVRSAKARLGP